MASSIGSKRRNTASPSINELTQGSPRSLIDALAVMAIGLSVGLLLTFSGATRVWAVEALGYGWVPAGLFVAVILATLRYNRHILFGHWRRWTVAAVLAAMSIGVLSTIFPSEGALKDVSLGGRWGSVLGGTPAILAAFKILGGTKAPPTLALLALSLATTPSSQPLPNCSGCFDKALLDP